MYFIHHFIQIINLGAIIKFKYFNKLARIFLCIKTIPPCKDSNSVYPGRSYPTRKIYEQKKL